MNHEGFVVPESELQVALLQLVGRTHPILVHFPVALLVVAAISELGGLFKKSSEVSAMARGLVWFALPATFAASFAGWTMSEREPISRVMASTLEWHRWTAVGVLALTFLCVLLRNRTTPFRATLFCGAIGVGVTGHFGGTMSWGEGYLLEPLQTWRASNTVVHPEVMNQLAGVPSDPEVDEPSGEPAFTLPVELEESQPPKSPEVATETNPSSVKMDFVKDIQPILEAYCVECHGSRKKKGGLRLEPISDAFPEGDEDFWTILPGDGSSSLLVQRMLLPRDDDEAMPPKGDGVPAADIQKIVSWVNDGAHGPGLDQIKRIATQAPDARRLDPLGVPEPTEAQMVLIEKSVAALRERGAVVQSVAQRHFGLEVNLSLLRPAASNQDLLLLRGIEPVLVRLDLSRSAVSDPGLLRMSGFPELRDLRLGGTQLGNAIAPVVQKSPKLSRLNLYGTRCTDDLFVTLSKLKKLERLHIWGSGMTNEAALAFALDRPSLRITGVTQPLPEPVPEVLIAEDTNSVEESSVPAEEPAVVEVDAVDFASHIKPIFEARCVSCHGPKKKKGGLRLEPIAAAFPEGEEDWWTILPGDAMGSLLMERIKLSDDDDGVMPPRGDLLTKEEIMLIEKWIAQGAKHSG